MQISVAHTPASDLKEHDIASAKEWFGKLLAHEGDKYVVQLNALLGQLESDGSVTCHIHLFTADCTYSFMTYLVEKMTIDELGAIWFMYKAHKNLRKAA